MKTYTARGQLRMVGKVWEIRATLRHMSKKNETLQEWLLRRDRATRR
ncbi:Z-ring formation inhibitor MciZ [Brevibacillus sp. SYP-B805]|nr:Z-ring formation inhibitor MciZ [Brevibacillus sp. SYP-B805]